MNKGIQGILHELIVVAAALFWCIFLRKSDALLAPYTLTALLSVAASLFLLRLGAWDEPKDSRIAADIGAAMLSGAVALANYGLLPLDYNGMLGIFRRIMNLCLLLCSGYILFRQLFRWLYWKMRAASHANPKASRESEKRVFLLGWLILALVYLAAMFLSFYPGLFTSDSIDQMTQIQTGRYTNHHPFYNSQLIRLFLTLGDKLFGNLNAGVATYSVFSVLMMSCCFAYVLCTVYSTTGSRGGTIAAFAWFLLMPFHITYSFSVWKDVPFAAAVTFFITSGFRMLESRERHRSSLVVWVLSAIGVCLLRSNGLLAFAASTVVFGLLFHKKEKKLLLILAAVICGCFVLKHPVLKAMNVAQPDTIESLSIPLQQISRAVLEGKPLTSEEEQLLNQVVDVERIPETYTGRISDPMKMLVRERNNQAYLQSHKLEYLKLYITLGLKNPSVYVHAWVDETKGYWNGGYRYWRWYDEEIAAYFGAPNELGLENTVFSASARQAYLSYASLFTTPVLQPLSSLGLYTWALLLGAYAAWLKRDKNALFTTVLPIMIVGTLLAATPVYAEFRYAYSVACVLPMVIAACLSPKKVC